MTPSRFTLCALAGAITLALHAPAFAEESTIVVTGAEQGSALPAWTNSATKSAVAESKTPQVITTLSAPEIDKRHANSRMKSSAMRRAFQPKCGEIPPT